MRKKRENFVRLNVLPIWFDDELRENIKKRDSLKKNSDWDSYKKQRNYVTNLVNKKKRSYLSELVKRSKNKNTKPVWEALNLGHNKKKLCIEESTLDAETLNFHGGSFETCWKIYSSIFSCKQNRYSAIQR